MREASETADEVAAAARRRRERRLRQFLRYERLSVAMALAEMKHHTAPRGQKTAWEGGASRAARRRSGRPPPSPVGALRVVSRRARQGAA